MTCSRDMRVRRSIVPHDPLPNYIQPTLFVPTVLVMCRVILIHAAHASILQHAVEVECNAVLSINVTAVQPQYHNMVTHSLSVT